MKDKIINTLLTDFHLDELVQEVKVVETTNPHYDYELPPEKVVEDENNLRFKPRKRTVEFKTSEVKAQMTDQLLDDISRLYGNETRQVPFAHFFESILGQLCHNIQKDFYLKLKKIADTVNEVTMNRRERFIKFVYGLFGKTYYKRVFYKRSFGDYSSPIASKLQDMINSFKVEVLDKFKHKHKIILFVSQDTYLEIHKLNYKYSYNPQKSTSNGSQLEKVDTHFNLFGTTVFVNHWFPPDSKRVIFYAIPKESEEPHFKLFINKEKVNTYENSISNTDNSLIHNVGLKMDYAIDKVGNNQVKVFGVELEHMKNRNILEKILFLK